MAWVLDLYAGQGAENPRVVETLRMLIDDSPRIVAPRTARMTMTLLAACDPCGYITAGGSPVEYAALADQVALRLTQGGRHAEILAVFPGQANGAAALQCATAALDWWTRDHSAASRPALVITL